MITVHVAMSLLLCDFATASGRGVAYVCVTIPSWVMWVMSRLPWVMWICLVAQAWARTRYSRMPNSNSQIHSDD